MAIAKTYDFSPNTTIASAQVDQNFDDCINAIKADHHTDADGTEVADTGLKDGVFIPIGGVIAWWSDGGNIPTNWEICDGAVVTTPESPLLGLTKPNLITKFIRGVANSNLRVTPQPGGADTHSHVVDSHGHGIGSDGSHGHTVNSHYHDVFGECNGNYGGGCANAANGAAGHGQSGLTSPGTDSQGSHNHGGGTGNASPNTNTQNNIPAYIGLVYIMRVK